MTYAEQIALTGGEWRPVGGIVRWIPTPAPQSPKKNGEPFQAAHLVACTTCGARVDESCRTRAGTHAKPHAGRLAPRLCACGAVPLLRAAHCQACARTEMAA